MSDRRLAQKGARPAALPAAAVREKRRTAIDIDTLHGHFGYFIRRLQVWVFQDFIRTLAPIDIRPAQYSVLIVIAANPGLSQSDLADTLGIERARLVRLLDKLEKRGLTQRLASRTDRRSHALAAEHEARIIARIGTEQRKSLIDALGHLDS
jgi:DNA-binding MarR family transcriptional regulator